MSDTTEKKVLLTVTLEVKQMIADLAVTKKAIADLKAEQKGLDQTTDEGRKAFESYGAEIRNLNTTAKEQQKTIDTTIKSQQAQKGSLDQMAASLKSAKSDYSKLSEEQRNTSAGKAMLESINAQKKALGEAGVSSNNFTGFLDQLTGKLNLIPTSGAGIKAAMSGITTGMGAVIKQMWLMVANPIGAVLAAIAVVGFALYKIFKDFDPVVEAVEKGFAALGAVFSLVKNLMIGLITGGTSLSDTFSNLGGKMNEAAKEAIALKEAEQSLEHAQSALEVQNKKDETQIQKLILQSKNRTLSEQERMALIDQALKIENNRYERLKKNNEEEQKIAFGKLIEGKNFTAAEIARLKREGVAYAEKLMDVKNVTREEIDLWKNSLLKKEDIEQQSTAIQEKAQNRADVLDEKAQAKAEKAAEKAVQAAEKAQAALEKRQEKELKSMENIYNLKVKMQKDLNSEMLVNDTYYTKRIEMINSNWSEEKKIIDKELLYKKINAEEASLKYIDAEKKKNDSIKALNLAKLNQIVSSLQYELSLHRLKDDEIIAGTKQTAEQQHYTELLRIRQDQEEQIKEQQAKLASDPAYQSEYERQIELIRQKGRTLTAQNNTAWEEKERQRKLNTAQTDLNNELSIAQGNIDREYELKLKGLEAQKEAELLAAETSGADIALINEKYAKQEQDLALETTKKKFENIKQYADAGMGVLNGLNELQKAIEAGQLQDAEEKNTSKIKLLDDQLAKGTISQKQHDDQVVKSAEELDKKKKKIAYDQAVREKELNVFKTIINTASAIVAALPNIPLSILAGITGAIELATIVATPLPKASRGMLLNGKSHAQGGIPIEAEGGEAIINKNSTSMFAPILSLLNEAGGGVAFSPSPAFRNDGGYASRQAVSSNSLTAEQIKQAMKEAVSEVRVITTIEDYRKADVNYTKIQDRSNY